MSKSNDDVLVVPCSSRLTNNRVEIANQFIILHVVLLTISEQATLQLIAVALG